MHLTAVIEKIFQISTNSEEKSYSFKLIYLSMMDHNLLREEISSARRYCELKNLKMTIFGLRNKIPISLYTELGGRIGEKIIGFEYPQCNTSRITIIYSNGLMKPLETDEYHRAMSHGGKLLDYIFTHYVSMKDFEREDEIIKDTFKKQKLETLRVNHGGFSIHSPN